MKASRKNKDGGVLLMVMLMFLVLMALSVGMFKLLELNGIKMLRSEGRVKAFWLAEAGLAEFRATVEPWVNRAPLASMNLVGPGVIAGTLDGVGDYRVDISDYTGGGWSNADSAAKRYLVRSTGIVPDGTTETIEVQARVGTFADFIYATDREGQNIWFISGDVLEGRMHSNDRFKINGTPRFNGKVTSAADRIIYNDSRAGTFEDPRVFQGGLQLGAPELDFGQYGSDPIEHLQAGANVLLNGNYDIEFIGDNYMYRPHYLGGGDPPAPWITNAISARHLVYATGDVYVKGRVGGEISVASEETIHIIGDVVYDSSPNNNFSAWPDGYTPDSDELLGLISKEAVQVDSLGVGVDINIHAAIYITKADDVVQTRNPGFGTEDRYTAISSPSINLLGSISQYTRGIVGSTSGRSFMGFRKNYSYDRRFIDTPPPGIPYSAYEFSEWRLP